LTAGPATVTVGVVDDGTRTSRGDLPAGDFRTWLGLVCAALRHEADADVPCSDCSACCSTSHFVHIGPDEAETLAVVPGDLLFPAPGLPPGHLLLPYDARGRCPLLDEAGRCTIHERRPWTCRTYDCRVFAAAGIGADREAISERARRWRFAFAEPEAAHLQAAVAAAARWIPEHAAAFPGGAVPDDPAQLAVLAVRVAGVFLPDGLAASGAGDDTIAAAVVEAAG
jgi:hypothetical protein